MYSLARESRNYGRRPSLWAGNGNACGCRFSPWGVKTTSWFSRTGGSDALSVISSLEASFRRPIP
uniref:Uncharacterized protein n=1 Tax=Oryza punctata TaxID=4537 RepID=A0A0E0L715_ORYPU